MPSQIASPIRPNRSAEHLPTVLDYISKWATAELLRGLLANADAYRKLGAGATPAALAESCELTERQVTSLLLFLEAEEIVQERDGVWWLSELGLAADQLRGWIELFLDGYGGYFRNAEMLWSGRTESTWRDMRSVGVGSVGISRHGALPLTIEVIDEVAPDADFIVDVGCANAAYLVELSRLRPTLHGVGVEPAASLREEARALIAQAGLGQRLSVVSGLEALPATERHPDFFVFGFVLHELVEQLGDDGLVGLLRRIGDRHPTSRVLAIEVDAAKRQDREEMSSDPYLRGYYNPYFLLHDFTNQRLLTCDQWRALFARAGYRVELERPIPPTFDPTGLELAFVLAYESADGLTT